MESKSNPRVSLSASAVCVWSCAPLRLPRRATEEDQSPVALEACDSEERAPSLGECGFNALLT